MQWLSHPSKVTEHRKDQILDFYPGIWDSGSDRLNKEDVAPGKIGGRWRRETWEPLQAKIGLGEANTVLLQSQTQTVERTVQNTTGLLGSPKSPLEKQQGRRAASEAIQSDLKA